MTDNIRWVQLEMVPNLWSTVNLKLTAFSFRANTNKVSLLHKTTFLILFGFFQAEKNRWLLDVHNLPKRTALSGAGRPWKSHFDYSSKHGVKLIHRTSTVSKWWVENLQRKTNCFKSIFNPLSLQSIHFPQLVRIMKNNRINKIFLIVQVRLSFIKVIRLK